MLKTCHSRFGFVSTRGAYDRLRIRRPQTHRVRFRQPEHNNWFVHYLFAQESRRGARTSRGSEVGPGAGVNSIQHIIDQAVHRFGLPLKRPLKNWHAELDRLGESVLVLMLQQLSDGWLRCNTSRA
jgi:hypothetical protein